MTVLTLAGLCGLLLLVAFAALILRLQSRGGVPEPDPAWLKRFSLTRYRPMARLLDEEDFRVLASLPGYRPEIGEKLRRERRKIFRAYLRRLKADFLRLHAAVRLAVAHSQEDSSDLVLVLFRQRLTFQRAILAVEVRLALHALGFGPLAFPVNPSRLLEAVDRFRMELQRLAPAPVTVA